MLDGVVSGFRPAWSFVTNKRFDPANCKLPPDAPPIWDLSFDHSLFGVCDVHE